MLIENLSLENRNLGIGTKTLFKNLKGAQSRSESRPYFTKVNGKIQIVAKLDKDIKK